MLVCSADFETHMEVLYDVAKCLRNAKLTINIEKTKFCQREIKYLLYIVDRGCLKVDSSKVECIVNFPVPRSPRQVRLFMGMAN